MQRSWRARWAIASLWIAGCGVGSVPAIDPPLSPTMVEEVLSLNPDEHLIRASIALRGQHPTAEELARVRQDPDALEELVTAYIDSDAFGAVMRDMHAELFLTRTDAADQLPSVDLLEHLPTEAIYEAVSEEPLRLVEHLIATDRPYTEILTADFVVANDMLALIYDLPFDPDGPEWQVSHYTDGRHHAGILGTSEIFRRHESAGSNFNRGRADFLATALLCESFNARDVVVDGGLDLSDEAAVANAVRDDEGCASCHQAMDPLAATFFGYKPQMRRDTVNNSYRADCRWTEQEGPESIEHHVPADACYPLRMYSPATEGQWESHGLRAPSYYGSPVRDISDLAQQMAADPRFSSCSARRFYGWFAQLNGAEVPLEVVAELQDVFVDSGYDAKALVRHIVLSPRFATLASDAQGDAPLLKIRPEAYASIIEDLTGFRWAATPNEACGNQCWTEVDLGRTDLYGFRSMSGGIDSVQVLRPTHTSSPMQLLSVARFAEEAASYVVDHDLSAPPDERLLLQELPADDEAGVREQLAQLSERVLLNPNASDHAEIDELYALWSDTAGHHGDPYAYKLVVSLLLQDPRLLHY